MIFNQYFNVHKIKVIGHSLMHMNIFLIVAFFYLVRRLNTVLENNLSVLKKT